MIDYDSAAEKRTDTEANVDERTRKALTETVSILEHGPRVKGADGLYEVFPCSGAREDAEHDTYVIDARRAVCECPDYQFREPEDGCKHVKRLKFVLGVEEAPVEIPADEISSQIGHGVADGRRVEEIVADREGDDSDDDPEGPAAGAPKAVADGGEVLADYTEGKDETDDVLLGGEPDDEDECACDRLPGDYPCAACYVGRGAEWPDDEGGGEEAL